MDLKILVKNSRCTYKDYVTKQLVSCDIIIVLLCMFKPERFEVSVQKKLAADLMVRYYKKTKNFTVNKSELSVQNRA